MQGTSIRTVPTFPARSALHASLGHECAYDEVRKKSGPKRGYVKQLEARLAQVETLLKTQEVNPSQNSQGNSANIAAPKEFVGIPEAVPFTNSIDAPRSSPEGEINNIQSNDTFLAPGLDRTGNFGWDMISLGLEEPLPDREIIDELNNIYFEKIHPYMPILHRPRHLAAMDLAPSMISHMDLTALNPFMSYSVYVAARVFVQYLKSRPDDSAARSSLGFVFTALDAMKNKNPLTESFLVQLDVDIEGTPFRDIRQAKRPRITNVPNKVNLRIERSPNITISNDQQGRGCTPLVPLDQSQKQQSLSAGPQQNYYTPSSLPSREEQSLPQLQNRNPPSDPFAKSPFNLSSGTESGPGTDTGLSPEFTDKSSNNSPASNDPSILNPTTIHDPSSSTYMPLDQSSPLKQQLSTSSSLNQANHQQSHPSLDTSSAVNMSMGTGPFGAFDIGFNSQLYPTGMVTPLDSNGSEGSIPMPTWDFGAPQTSNGENVDMITTGMESLEAQWAQLLGSGPGTGTGTGWDSWRNQA
ncbi:hypothetical protein APSETT445_002635 [Aspergillus pseudonomiae]